MKGIKFGNHHSWNDFQLILASKTIGTPSPKTETIDIPGGDGVLDRAATMPIIIPTITLTVAK